MRTVVIYGESHQYHAHGAIILRTIGDFDG